MSGENGQMKEFNPKLGEYDKKLQMIYAEVRTKAGFFYNFVENIINKKSYDRSCISVVIYGHS